MHITLQADGEPGVYVLSTTGGSQDDTQGLTPNLIWYLGLDNIHSSVNEENVQAFEYEIMPNPASEQFFVKATLNSTEDIRFTMVNILGETVYSDIRLDVSGNIYLDVPVQDLSAGTYFGVLEIGKERATRKIIVE